MINDGNSIVSSTQVFLVSLTARTLMKRMRRKEEETRMVPRMER